MNFNRHHKSPGLHLGGNRTRQKNKRGDIEKWDQTESPEIPDREETSEIPGLPSGEQERERERDRRRVRETERDRDF